MNKIEDYKKQIRDEYRSLGNIILSKAQEQEVVWWLSKIDSAISVCRTECEEKLVSTVKAREDEIVDRIEKVKTAVQKATGSFKYSDCYDDCIKIIKSSGTSEEVK